ncbi:MAG TPA: hypothetical protein HA350_04755, partial [Candidatus Nitrosotenuis sp.]|nr:hypothetical protein [Candidatus Nitrosotenuis sp.]
FDGPPKYGDHKIKISVRYKDDARQEHVISEEANVLLKDLNKKPEPTAMDFIPGLVTLIVLGSAGYIAYKKIKKRRQAQAETESH